MGIIDKENRGSHWLFLGAWMSQLSLYGMVICLFDEGRQLFPTVFYYNCDFRPCCTFGLIYPPEMCAPM